MCLSPSWRTTTRHHFFCACDVSGGIEGEAAPQVFLVFRAAGRARVSTARVMAVVVTKGGLCYLSSYK